MKDEDLKDEILTEGKRWNTDWRNDSEPDSFWILFLEFYDFMVFVLLLQTFSHCLCALRLFYAIETQTNLSLFLIGFLAMQGHLFDMHLLNKNAKPVCL